MSISLGAMGVKNVVWVRGEGTGLERGFVSVDSGKVLQWLVKIVLLILVGHQGNFSRAFQIVT